MRTYLNQFAFLFALTLTGCGIVTGNPAQPKGPDSPEPEQDETAGGSTESACELATLSEGGEATSQVVFNVGEGIDPCSVTGYIVGLKDTFNAQWTGGDAFVVDKVPQGTHDFIIENSQGGLRLNDVETFNSKRKDFGKVDLKAFGSIAGKVLLTGKSDHSGADVYIPGTNLVAKSAKDGSFRIEHVPHGVHNLQVDVSGFSRGRVEEMRVEPAMILDVGEIRLAIDTGVDGFISINDGQTTTRSHRVSVVVGASDDAILMKVSESANFENIAWKP